MSERNRMLIAGAAGAIAVGYAVWRRYLVTPAATFDPVQALKDRVTGMAQGATQLHLMYLGEELGLFSAFTEKGALTPEQLASAAGMNARYAAEWCLAMAGIPILDYDASTGKFTLKAELIPAFADQGTLAIGASAIAALSAHDKLLAAYKSGGGIGWGDHSHLLYCGTKRFFAPLYENALVPNLPPSVRDALESGGAAADIGCGEGVSCIVLGRAFPRCSIDGFDFHAPSIDAARRATRLAGVGNVSYSVAAADEAGGRGKYDVVTFFDCFHDMAVAAAAAKNAYEILKPGGQVLLIELLGPEEDTVQAKLAMPTTPLFSCFSCHFCLPCGMCDGGDALGTTVATSVHRRLFVERAGFASLESVPSPLNNFGFRLLLAKKLK